MEAMESNKETSPLLNDEPSLDQSDQHKNKDFQLVGVPNQSRAVSACISQCDEPLVPTASVQFQKAVGIHWAWFSNEHRLLRPWQYRE